MKTVGKISQYKKEKEEEEEDLQELIHHRQVHQMSPASAIHQSNKVR